MIELVVLVAAVALLAVAMRPFLDWLWLRDWQAYHDHLERLAEERREREYLAGLYAGIAAGRPNAHALITGITS